jgi:hypothetical protein
MAFSWTVLLVAEELEILAGTSCKDHPMDMLERLPALLHIIMIKL